MLSPERQEKIDKHPITQDWALHIARQFRMYPSGSWPDEEEMRLWAAVTIERLSHRIWGRKRRRKKT
jgi:hypothetical protein